MFKHLAISTLMFGSVLGFAQAAQARDRDDYRRGDQRVERRDYDRRDNDRRDYDRGGYYRRDFDRRDHERFERRYDRRIVGDLRYGYYDRFNRWCWY